MTKFCKDCKWYKEGKINNWCNNPKNGISLVTGNTLSQFATSVRNNSNRCGTKAAWFEEKEIVKVEPVSSASYSFLKGLT